MKALAIYTLLSAAMFYLGSRALITQAIWSRYPQALAGFMDCPACTGFWWGAIWSIVLGLDVEPLPSRLVVAPLIGLCTLVLTPIAAGLMQWSLDQVGHVALIPDQGGGIVKEPMSEADTPLSDQAGRSL